MEYNIYCDESCYMEKDNSKFMAIGGIYCPKEKVVEISNEIKKIKTKHFLPSNKEIKWTKISNANKSLYIDIINYFFETNDLNFRNVIVDKTSLNHEIFNQTHDEFYYKIYFVMLSKIFDKDTIYNVYVDIKDTHSFEKCSKLHEVCCNANYDFHHNMIKKIQPIRSDESQIMQLADVLIGAVLYSNRFNNDKVIKQSEAKREIVELIKSKTKYSLSKSTYLNEKKFNVLFWEGI